MHAEALQTEALREVQSMGAVGAVLVLLVLLVMLFLWRVWQYLARHPILRLLDGTNIVFYLQEADEEGNLTGEQRIVRVHLRGYRER